MSDYNYEGDLLQLIDSWIEEAKNGDIETMYIDLMQTIIHLVESEDILLRKALVGLILIYLRARIEHPNSDELILRYRMRDTIERAVSHITNKREESNARQKS